MPAVYIIELDPNINNFQTLTTEEEDKLDQLEFRGLPKGKNWDPPSFYVPNPLLPKPDIWDLGDAIAVSNKTAGLLAPFIDQSCEVLPIRVNKQELLVLNITYVLDCLDKSKSKLKGRNFPAEIKNYVFRPKRLEYSLFKIPQNLFLMFAVEGLDSPEDEFKGVVEKNGLTGISFRKVWSDEG